MIEIISDNIISPLGFTSEETYQAVKKGETGIKKYRDIFETGIEVSASFIDNNKLDEAFSEYCLLNPQKYTKVEKAALLSIKKASENCEIDLRSNKTAFYLSSTKGNVQLLDKGIDDNQQLEIWHTAKLISNFFGNNNTPTVISNACISGICAIISASRALENKRIDYAVVTGVDMLSKFIISGFTCLKALSPTPCKPFDKERIGLNLGEAAATVILKRAETKNQNTKFVCGSIRNDANHISGPSRTGEGSYNALCDIIKNVDINDIAFINAHGTSTNYNDEMESIAIDRASLNNVLVNSLKSYFGHTLGAAGIVESIISSKALKDNTILKTYGYENKGVSGNINISNANSYTDKKHFIKLISGFGGCNASALFKIGE
ncbi:MAG: beta-ketoacyl synthase [Bacteroidales bacterium]|nr:beta-ketoacyl synthase [Bacteroidales bacterium]